MAAQYPVSGRDLMDDIVLRCHLRRPGFTLDVKLGLPGSGVTALFGPSGSGKTTLLRVIAGLQRTAEGLLTFKGECWQGPGVWVPPHRRRLGYVFQEASLFSHLTVLGNLRYGLTRSPAKDIAALGHAIELLGIGHLLDRGPEGLSGGERQRVAIARALAASPRILLMDEPLAALDLKRKLEILPYLKRLHDELDIPILYVTHSPDEVARLADHIVVMDDGRVIANGPLRETLARLDLPVRLGEDLGVVFDATVGEIDSTWHMARLDFKGGALWTPDRGGLTGAKVRVRVLASDVSLAQMQPQHSGIENVLRGRIDAIATDDHPGLSLVRVSVGETAFVARLTRRAVYDLAVDVGQEVWLQVKSVALMG